MTHEEIKSTKAFKAARIYDNGGKTWDRYTVVYMTMPEYRPGTFFSVGMSERPFDPQGFGQHDAAMPGRHLGRRITFDQLPHDCQLVMLSDCEG